VTPTRQRSWWGWGWVDQALTDDECADLAKRVRPFLPLDGRLAPVPDLESVPPPPARPLQPPPSLEAICSSTAADRAAHTYGKAYRDVVRSLRGDLSAAPDLVVYARDEGDIESVLDWAAGTDCTVVPFGGGTSVVGGVECRDRSRAVVSLDLSRLSGIVEIDEVSLAAHIRAGTLGPTIEDGLRPYGLTLRHFPQSFEFSTLGGWIATRAGGHYATGYTHIDDLVEAVRVVTPVGVAQSLRVPSSGAGPSPDRLWLGSEGTLGVVTDAWVRVQRRPRFTAASAVRFEEYTDGVAATRDLAQSGLQPANCRLLDALESMIGANVTDGSCRLLLSFESPDHDVSARLARAIEICQGHRGRPEEVGESAAQWRGTFLRAPYLRDGLARLGVVVETFETACTWAGFDALRAAVVEAVTSAGLTSTGSPAVVGCRFTHVYPDGPAAYFTVYAAGRRGAEVEIWDTLKVAASDAIAAHGGTITHHHAVGRDHRPWYDLERPEPFAVALRAAKAALDPHRILNPGVLI
jgi:alkyldihydroxyacetonephosphate synthase